MSTRREFLLGAAGAPWLAGQAPARRPNIIFFLTDDQRWDQMGCAGHPDLKTPHMDRLAREGARFTNMFVTTSLCSPSRACFLTGRYAHAHGVRGNQRDIAQEEMRRAYPALLRAAGYETAYFGKFHMGNNPQPHAGFDHWAVLPGQGRYLNPLLNINGEMKTLEGHSGRVTTDLALDWLKKPRRQPFCMVLGFKEPHGPRTPPDHLKELYAAVKIERPAVTPEQLRGKPKEILERRRGAAGANAEAFAEDCRNYMRCITAADEQMGRVLAWLDDARLAQDTLVAFAGDNGYFFGEFGLGDKRYGYDVALRIPMLVRYPRLVKPGTLIDKMALNIDFCPTLLDLAGAPVPKSVHGVSWRPLFENRPGHWRASFLYEYFKEGQFPPPTIRGIRTERYKYLEYPDTDNTPELYDLVKDPREWNNLSDRPLMARLKQEMERIEAETR